MKYLVMECHPGYAVVLSEDGRFLKVSNLHYEVGQTVTEIIEVCLPQPQKQMAKPNNRRWVSALAAMAACLTLMVTFFVYGQLPYASVYMTINPEIRIDVNRLDRVVQVEGMNADGAQLLTGYEPGRKDLDAVMDELVDRAMDMGYLHEGGRITVSLDGSDAWVNSHSDHLNDHLKEHLKDALTVIIDVQTRPQESSKPDAPAVPTAPVGPIVIPVGPEEYQNSDYGEAENDSGYDAGSDDGRSDYDDSDEKQSDYAAESDYDDPDSDYASVEDGQSDYRESDDASAEAEPSDYGESDYASVEDGQSDYGASEYAASAPAAGTPDSDDSGYDDSGYEEPAPVYGGGAESDYDQSDYAEFDDD